MSSPIFRRAALERLSSPEELDQVVTISIGGAWAALTAILLMCAAAVVWAMTASLPTTATGSGMVAGTGGVLNVVSRGSGIVRSIDVAIGQHLDANQVVATIAQPVLTTRLRGLRDELQEVLVKHEQDRQLKREETELRLEALARQRANLERSVAELAEQARLAAERVPAMEQLFARGLVTNQQVIAARQTLVELNGQSADRSAQLKQLDAQAFELRTQTAALDAATRLDIASRERQIAAATGDLSLQETVVSPYAGDVVEIKVSAGSPVADGTPILSIQPDAKDLEVVAYVSALQAKDIRAGMDARVSPSTVRREEYGYIRGTVTAVATYPSTAAAIMRNFQNEQLVQALTSAGPVTEVRIGLEQDPATISGFRWSSSAGPPIRISAGTIAVADIVTETRAPITLVVPVLRRTLGL
jgi:HlyD family secretion protein